MAPPREPRPLRSPAPPLPPMEALDHDHARMLQMLSRLETLLAHLGDQGPDAAAQASAAEALQFFAGGARAHHDNEERHVFPELLATGKADLVQHVQRLQQDHRWLEQDWQELHPQVEAIARGYNWYDLEMLRQALPVFSALYHEHIALEESLIYPEARRRQQLRHDAAGRQG